MQNQSEYLNILVVEDNPADQFLLEQMLSDSGLRIRNIHCVPAIAGAKALLEQTDIHLVFLDLSLPDSFGIESLKNIRALTQRIPVIVLTGLNDSETALEALQHSAQDFLVKGEFNSSLLVKSVEYSLERKKAEEHIIASEEKYRLMFYKNPLPMWIHDAETLSILEVNDAAIHKYGYCREAFLQLTLEDVQEGRAQAGRMALADGMREKLWKHRKSGGETMVVEFTCYPIHYMGRTAIQAQVNDITENIRLNNELAHQKKQLIEAVLNAQENERKNIGRELHDNINQILTAVRLHLGFALEQSDNRDILTRCTANLGMAVEEIRKLSKELILPGNLRELGLAHSIEDLVKEVLLPTSIRWKLYSRGLQEKLLPEELKLTVYRILQEQLNNILKHAGASAVAVSLEASGTSLQLKITDDGKGFDVGLKRKGLGLSNIVNRAELFNGEVIIDSAPGKGCSLEVTLYFKPAAACQLPVEGTLSVN
jgi:two-component system sensor histidine kinase UhpB